MKTRKTNRAKQVSGSCSNNGSCPVCRGNRTHANVRAEPAPDVGEPTEPDDPDVGDYGPQCLGCGGPLSHTVVKYRRFGGVYCSLLCACGETSPPPSEPLVSKLPLDKIDLAIAAGDTRLLDLSPESRALLLEGLDSPPETAETRARRRR